MIRDQLNYLLATCVYYRAKIRQAMWNLHANPAHECKVWSPTRAYDVVHSIVENSDGT